MEQESTEFRRKSINTYGATCCSWCTRGADDEIAYNSESLPALPKGLRATAQGSLDQLLMSCVLILINAALHNSLPALAVRATRAESPAPRVRALGGVMRSACGPALTLPSHHCSSVLTCSASGSTDAQTHHMFRNGLAMGTRRVQGKPLRAVTHHPSGLGHNQPRRSSLYLTRASCWPGLAQEVFLPEGLPSPLPLCPG